MALVLASQLLLIAVCGAVGGRILWLARRTRGAPEVLIGLGLITIVLTLPLLGASGIGRVPAGELRLGPLAAGIAVLAFAQTLIAAFTWRTFRPGAGWALGLFAVIAAAQAATCLAAYQSVVGLPADADPTVGARGWLAGMRVPGSFAYLWTAIEGLREWSRARRRRALGLSDPMVVNRLALWTVVGGVAVLNNVVSTGLQLAGLGPVHTVTGAVVVAIGGVASSVPLYLAFLPPPAYRRWVVAAATAG